MKKRYWALGTIGIIIGILMIALFILPGTNERSVSNLYIIPAGTFSIFHEKNVPAEQSVTGNISGCIQKPGSEDYYNQGIYYNNHDNQYDKALENFNKSVGLEPDNPKIWFARSVTLYNLKRYDEALESLDTTLEIDQDYGAAWFLKGDVLRIEGRVNESEECLAKAKEFGYSS